MTSFKYKDFIEYNYPDYCVILYEVTVVEKNRIFVIMDTIRHKNLFGCAQLVSHFKKYMHVQFRRKEYYPSKKNKIKIFPLNMMCICGLNCHVPTFARFLRHNFPELEAQNVLKIFLMDFSCKHLDLQSLSVDESFL